MGTHPIFESDFDCLTDRKKSKMKVLNCPTKSPADKKTYRAIELPNGLRALLISQPTEETEKVASAVSMVVEAGSMHEPRGIAGLAHFCEHLLFMGTEKYPDENTFDNFVSKFGGYSNASTHDGFTRYHFEMMEKTRFKEALDIWAQFFISPLMKRNTVEREINAVDSEFDLARQNDWCRKLFVMQARLMTPGHPEQQNGWGNGKMILEVPKENGIDSYDVLQEWYPRHYSSKWMQLCIQSPHSLDELESYVTSIFADVPTRPGLEKPATDPFTSTAFSEAFLEGEKNRLIKYCPIKDELTLDMWFHVPTLQQHFTSDPSALIGYLLGHEGDGSVLEKLKQEGLATELYIDANDHSPISTHIEISIRLTDKGFDQWQYCYQSVFAYIDMINEASSSELARIQAEVASISHSNWLCQEEGSPTGNVTRTSRRMSLLPEEYWLKGRNAYEFDEQLIRSTLRTLTMANCLTFLSSKSFEQLDVLETEPYTDAKYKIENVSLEVTPESREKLHLPTPNRYIASDFSIKQGTDESTWKVPRLIDERANGELWFKGDSKFSLPRGKASFHFRHQTPHAGLLHIYNKILTLKIAKVVYEAETTGLYYSISGDFSPRGNNFETGQSLRISVTGLNEKLSVLLNEILDEINSFDLTEAEFDSAKKEQIEDYNNTFIKPKRLAVDVCSQLTVEPYESMFETITWMKALDFETFNQLRKTIWSDTFVQGHIEGNFTQAEARAMFDLVMVKLACSGERELMRFESVKQVKSPVCLKFENFNKTDGNSYVIAHYQLGQTDLELRSRIDLMAFLTSEPAFDFLRTKNTLGYVCFTMAPVLHDYAGFSVIVGSQREKFTVEDVYGKMLEFHQHFLEKLEAMTDSEFINYRTSYIQSLTKAPTNLGAVFSANDARIKRGTYDFDYKEKKAAIVEKLTKSEIIDLYKKTVIDNQSHILVAIEGIEDAKQEDKQVLEMKSLTFATPETVKFNNITCMTSISNDTVEFM